MTLPLAIDLFSGAGAVSRGLEQAGYQVIGIDNWDDACETHNRNAMPALKIDLKTVDWSMFEHMRPDLVWASPPCPPFSQGGNHLGADDPRNGVPAYLRSLEVLRPRVTVMENVRGMTFKNHRPYLERVVRGIAARGYVVEWQVLNCADYGVPQTRQRLVVIGRSDDVPVWPMPTHGGRWVSMAAIFGWNEGERLLHTNRDQRPDGSRQVVVDGRPAPTMTTAPSQWKWSGGTLVTEQEAATLQGFPRDFCIHGRRAEDRWAQIGNAFPPVVARAIAEVNR